MSEQSLFSYAPDFRFLVITGQDSDTSAGNVCFSKISGIEVAMEQEEILEGGKNDGPHFLAAPHRKNPPLVLERGVLPSSSWMSRLKPGMRLGTWLQVILLDEEGLLTTKQFGISDGMVTRWELSGLDAMGSSILVEKLEIVHDGISYW